MNSLLQNCRILRVMPSAALGESMAYSAPVDVQGWDGVLFAVALGTNVGTGNIECRVQLSKWGYDYDLAEGVLQTRNMTAADAEKLVLFDVRKPTRRYVKLIVVRAAEIDGVVAILYRKNSPPAQQSDAAYSAGSTAAGVLASAVLISPDEVS